MPINFDFLPSFPEIKNDRFYKFSRFDNSEYWKDYYSKKLKSNDVGREKKYAQLLSSYLPKNAKIAEMASGIGFLSKELDKVGLRVTAIDLFDDMIKEAKKYLRGTNVKFLKKDISETGLPDESYDCVSAMSIIEHVSKDEVIDNVIPEFKRILKKDGYLFIHVPVKSSYSVFVKFLRKYIYRDLPEWAIDDDGDITHRFWISYKEYIKMFEDQGFKLINYDFYLTRSHLRPQILSVIMKKIQSILEITDVKFTRTIDQEPINIKILKDIKGNLSLTSYFLLKKVD
ncbi:MAG: methyltransferase domain-containing protein [Candidatus Pacebacteria bacterium]|nr:methyltransferase domain-containing protein [Candidatus Paceibacterota bacterium]